MDRIPPRRRLVVLAGPRAAGKTYLARQLTARSADFVIAPGVVTRPSRGEEDNNDLNVDEAQFEQMRGRLCLATRVGGHRYGYLRAGIDEALAAGKWVLTPLLHARDVARCGQLWPRPLRVYLRPEPALLRERLGRPGSRGGSAEQLLREAGRAVARLDCLPWDLRIDCRAGTETLPLVLPYLEAAT